jgi:thiol-disulfide isomerase/thioredoxin
MKPSIATSAAVFGLMLALSGVAFAATKPAAVAVGDTPPDDLGRSREGSEVLISGQRGKVVVVTFWASWCGYCRKELPVLAGLQEAAGKARLEVVAVNYEDDRDVYRALSRQLKDVQLTMTHDASGRIGEAFGVRGIPHLFVIGKNGKVAFQDVGYGEESVQVILDAVNAELARPAGS